APVISVGRENKEVMVGKTFDPMDGVTASDIVDGDLTSEITYVIELEGSVVTAIDSTVAGVSFEVTYSVSDAAGNTATAVVNVEVVSGFVSVIDDFSSDQHKLEQGSDIQFATMTKDENSIVITVTEVGAEAY